MIALNFYYSLSYKTHLPRDKSTHINLSTWALPLKKKNKTKKLLLCCQKNVNFWQIIYIKKFIMDIGFCVCVCACVCVDWTLYSVTVTKTVSGNYLVGTTWAYSKDKGRLTCEINIFKTFWRPSARHLFKAQILVCAPSSHHTDGGKKKWLNEKKKQTRIWTISILVLQM